jgi:hypothetical protein
MKDLAEKKKETAIVPMQDYAVMQYSPQELSDVISENLGADGLQVHELTTVKIPSGGVTVWSLPTMENPDGENVSEIEGVIILWKDARAYWEKSLDETGGGSEPDCQAQNGQWGVKRADFEGKLGGNCADCPMAVYGSDPKGGRGQACKQSRVLFLLQEDSLLPIMVRLAPTSIKPIRKFFLSLASNAVHYSAVRVRLTLDKAKNATNITYAVVKPQVIDRLEKEDAARIRAYAEQIRPFLENVTIDMADISDEPTEAE